MYYFKDEFNGEYSSENIVKVVEDGVVLRILIHWVLSCQSDTAGTDHNHNEQVEVAEVHDKVAKPTYSGRDGDWRLDNCEM